MQKPGHGMPITTITIMLPNTITPIMPPGIVATMMLPGSIIAMPPDTDIMAEAASPGPGADGICAGRSAPIPAPPTIWRDPGLHYGYDAGGPSVGAIVVWRHHVGKIVGQENGQWIVQSGNDGHAVRTRARSVAGAIAFRRA